MISLTRNWDHARHVPRTGGDFLCEVCSDVEGRSLAREPKETQRGDHRVCDTHGFWVRWEESFDRRVGCGCAGGGSNMACLRVAVRARGLPGRGGGSVGSDWLGSKKLRNVFLKQTSERDIAVWSLFLAQEAPARPAALHCSSDTWMHTYMCPCRGSTHAAHVHHACWLGERQEMSGRGMFRVPVSTGGRVQAVTCESREHGLTCTGPCEGCLMQFSCVCFFSVAHVLHLVMADVVGLHSTAPVADIAHHNPLLTTSHISSRGNKDLKTVPTPSPDLWQH